MLTLTFSWTKYPTGSCSSINVDVDVDVDEDVHVDVENLEMKSSDLWLTLERIVSRSALFQSNILHLTGFLWVAQTFASMKTMSWSLRPGSPEHLLESSRVSIINNLPNSTIQSEKTIFTSCE